MTDPAVSAARRVPASAQIAGDETWAIAAAREVLKPIRKLHGEWESEGFLPPEAWQILDALAPLIYPEEEL